MGDSSRNHFEYSLSMLVSYFVLAFGITWAVLVPALSSVPDGNLTPFFILAAFGPFLAAIITMWVGKGGAELRRWLRQIFRLRIPVVLYLAGAFLLPIAMGVLHFGLYAGLVGEADFSGAVPWYFYLLYLLPTAALTGGNEEPGWRGFALPALLERMHPLWATLILGIAHSAWHLPLMSYYDTTFGWYVFNVLPLTVILNWLYLKSRGSVIPVMLLHAGTNVIVSFLPTPEDVLDGLGTYMFLRGVVYWGMAIVILLVTGGRLGYESRPSRPRG